MIINELKFAKDIIAGCDCDEKPTVVLGVLAKYYIHHEGLDEKETTDKLDCYLKSKYADYDYFSWQKYFINTIKFAQKRKLISIGYIPITLNEMNAIKNIASKPLQRLAFSLLCYAKYFDEVNELNNHWTNATHKDVFSSAHIGKCVNEQCKMIHELYQLGLISLGKKISKLNIQVNFVDSKSDVVLQIIDFRELGYEYLRYNGEDYVPCGKCEKLFKQNKARNKIYCSECSRREKTSVKIIKCANCQEDIVVSSCDMKTKKCFDCKKLEEYKPIVSKEVLCVDCGEVFVLIGQGKRNRCETCYAKYRSERNRNRIS